MREEDVENDDLEAQLRDEMGRLATKKQFANRGREGERQFESLRVLAKVSQPWEPVFLVRVLGLKRWFRRFLYAARTVLRAVMPCNCGEVSGDALVVRIDRGF